MTKSWKIPKLKLSHSTVLKLNSPLDLVLWSYFNRHTHRDAPQEGKMSTSHQQEEEHFVVLCRAPACCNINQISEYEAKMGKVTNFTYSSYFSISVEESRKVAAKLLTENIEIMATHLFHSYLCWWKYTKIQERIRARLFPLLCRKSLKRARVRCWIKISF